MYLSWKLPASSSIRYLQLPVFNFKYLFFEGNIITSKSKIVDKRKGEQSSVAVMKSTDYRDIYKLNNYSFYSEPSHPLEPHSSLFLMQFQFQSLPKKAIISILDYI